MSWGTLSDSEGDRREEVRSEEVRGGGEGDTGRHRLLPVEHGVADRLS